MTSQNLENEITAALKESVAPAESRNVKFTAISGDARHMSGDARHRPDPLDGEYLVEVARQRLALARKALSEIELEHQVERAKLVQSVVNQLEEIKHSAQSKLLALDDEYNRRKTPARKMVALVSRLTESGE